MNKKMLFFGSLRATSKRGYNFDRFGKNTQKHIKTFMLDGFEMYDCNGHYPTICEGQGKIKVELHEVEQQVAAQIGFMERGAGYNEKIIKLDDGTEATIWVWDKAKIERYNLPQVKSGDWE